jgi:hypothetical protein
LDAIYIVLILTSIVATYWLVKRKSRKQNTFT